MENTIFSFTGQRNIQFYSFVANWQRISSVQVASTVKDGFQCSKNFAVGVHHSLNNLPEKKNITKQYKIGSRRKQNIDQQITWTWMNFVPINFSRALVWLNADIIVVNVASRHRYLKMVGSKHDGPSFPTEVGTTRANKHRKFWCRSLRRGRSHWWWLLCWRHHRWDRGHRGHGSHQSSTSSTSTTSTHSTQTCSTITAGAATAAVASTTNSSTGYKWLGSNTWRAKCSCCRKKNNRLKYLFDWSTTNMRGLTSCSIWTWTVEHDKTQYSLVMTYQVAVRMAKLISSLGDFPRTFAFKTTFYMPDHT